MNPVIPIIAVILVTSMSSLLFRLHGQKYANLDVDKIKNDVINRILAGVALFSVILLLLVAIIEYTKS